MNRFSERRLLSRVKENDRKAAEKLIDLNYETVFCFLCRLCKNRELAQDLTQETFIKVWKKIDGFNGDCKFSSWLYRISYNLFLDYSKKQKYVLVPVEADDLKVAIQDEIAVDKKVSNQDFHEILIQQTELLSPKLREVILLHYQEELSFQEIARILEIPKGTVKSRINSALCELRKLMQQFEK